MITLHRFTALLGSLFVFASCRSAPQPSQQELAWTEKLLVGHNYRAEHDGRYISRAFENNGCVWISSGPILRPGMPREFVLIAAQLSGMQIKRYSFEGNTLNIGTERYTLLSKEGETLKVANKGGPGPRVQMWMRSGQK